MRDDNSPSPSLRQPIQTSGTLALVRAVSHDSELPVCLVKVTESSVSLEGLPGMHHHAPPAVSTRRPGRRKATCHFTVIAHRMSTSSL